MDPIARQGTSLGLQTLLYLGGPFHDYEEQKMIFLDRPFTATLSEDFDGAEEHLYTLKCRHPDRPRVLVMEWVGPAAKSPPAKIPDFLRVYNEELLAEEN